MLWRFARLAAVPGLVLAALTSLPACESSPSRGSPAAVSSHDSSPATPTLDPASLVITSEPWTFESKEGQIIRTPSYRIFTTVSKPQIVNRLPVFLEHCLIHYSSSLGDLPRPSSPLETYVMATRPQWEHVTQRVMGKQADVYLRIQRGGFSTSGKAVLYDIGNRETFAIASHEGWHQYTQGVFGTALPVAFEEGLATYMEGFKWDPDDPDRPRFLPWCNFERFEQLRSDYLADRLTPLARLQQSTPQELIADDAESALSYYAQVWALIHFLNEGENGRYRNALRSLLADAASGDLLPKVRSSAGSRAASSLASRRRGVDLFPIYFGTSVDAADAEYRDFVSRIIKLGARQKIAAGKSPLSE